MAMLKCDICGGKLVMQAGGVSKCDSCGMEYSQERMREKVQEIKGTVTVDKSSEADNLLARALSFIECGNFHEAKEYIERILDLNVNHEGANLFEHYHVAG